MLSQGARAPDVSGVDQDGVTHRLKDYKARATLVYFYPKDETPGCTREACAFRDAWNQFRAADVQVFGVSNDTRESHRQFASNHSLAFPLIADPEGQWANAFGVGRKNGNYLRVSFLIGPGATIAKVYPNVDPAVHAEEVLKDVKDLLGH